MASSVSFELDAPVSAVVAPTNAQDKGSSSFRVEFDSENPS